MSRTKFTHFQVKRYRSLLDIKIDISDGKPIVICGENNIGKTNFLRALNLFFNHPFQEDMFSPKDDIPHHIYYGSQGAGSKTELVGTFDKDGKSLTIKVTFNNAGNVSYQISGKTANETEVLAILSEFQFIYVESHNVDIPKLISVVLEKDGLLPLDTKRKKQSQPLEKLEEFIKLSQSAISDIERDINICFGQLTDFDGILKGKQIRINFAEFEKLRDVVKTMTSITLHDGNNHGIASKGSGAQRAVFLSLMQFISQNSKRNIIWGVDEPEAFLQPRLQRKVCDVFYEIVLTKKQPVILTTHSQHFIKLNELSQTHIFKGEISEREYKRKANQIFYEMNTYPVECKSDQEKANLIKNHLGINNNDGWEVLPYNIIVEGEEDKKYLEGIFNLFDIPLPNIIWSGGASKIGGYLQYYEQFARDLSYKPEFLCIFDNDDEGREQAKKVKKYQYINVKVVPLPRHDGCMPSSNNIADWEIEDFLPPQAVLSAINIILKKDKYKPIKSAQISDRSKQAHIDKQILKYAEECSNQNNSDKAPFIIDDQGRKMQICKKICSEISKFLSVQSFNKQQIEFIKGLVK